MRAIPVFLLCLCSLSFRGFCQERTTEQDSLLNELKTVTTDSSRAEIFRSLGRSLMYEKPMEAIPYFKQSAEAYQQAGLGLMSADMLYSTGYCLRSIGRYDSALINEHKAAAYYEKNARTYKLVNAYLMIGGLHFLQHDYPKAGEYYQRAYSLGKEIDDTLSIIYCMSELGSYYDEVHEFKKAIDFRKQLIELSRVIGNPFQTALGFNNIAVTYRHVGEWKLSKQSIDSAEKILRTIDDPMAPQNEFWAELLHNKAEALIGLGHMKEAETCLDSALIYADNLSQLEAKKEIFGSYAKLYKSAGDFAQYAYYLELNHNAKDSLNSADVRVRFAQLEADYAVEKKNAEIARKSSELNSNREQRNRLVLLLILGSVFIITLAILYVRIRKSKGLLEKQNLEITQQRENLRNLNAVKDKLFSVISHDLRSPLSTLRSYLMMTESPTLSEEKKEHYRQLTLSSVTQTSQMLDNLLAWAGTQLNEYNTRITPVSLDDVLATVMSEVELQAAQKNIRIENKAHLFTVPANEQILSIALRNLLTNAVKFSPAGESITLSTEQDARQVRIKVSDHGKGMTASQIASILANNQDSQPGTNGEKGAGMGLYLVRELLHKINGQLRIESEPEKGSQFTILLPSLT